MLAKVSDKVRAMARRMEKRSYAEQSESPYQNINIYQLQTDPSDPSVDVGGGPPSPYNDTDLKEDRIKPKEDIRRQGLRPIPRDPLEVHILPMETTVRDEPKEDVQGITTHWTKPRGFGRAWDELNRETWRSEGPGGQFDQ